MSTDGPISSVAPVDAISRIIDASVSLSISTCMVMDTDSESPGYIFSAGTSARPICCLKYSLRRTYVTTMSMGSMCTGKSV